MVAPEALVGHVHAFFALAGGRGDRAIGVQDGLLEEGLRLALPDLDTNGVDRVHQGFHLGGGKASAKVPGGRGIGNPLGPQRIQIDLVVAQAFEVFQAVSMAEKVIRDVEYMIQFVIGQMTLEQMQVLIEGADQAALSGQQMYRPNATVGQAPGSFGQIIVDVRRREHGVVLFVPGEGLKSSLDSFLVSSPSSW